jgi:hypothetical protein
MFEITSFPGFPLPLKREAVDAMKYWKLNADNLSKASWSWGCVATIDATERTIWIVDAHRDDGKRFVARR